MAPTHSPNRLRRESRIDKEIKMNCLLLLRRSRLPGSGAARRRGLIAWCALALTIAGCRREQIQVYTVPKDKPAWTKVRPELSWTLPSGWKETGPGQMSLASFAISGADGQEAQVTISPLARLGGRDTEIVNMWREQVGLDPLSREEAARQFQPVTVGGEAGNLFDIEGSSKDGSSPTRIVTAMVHRSEASWFYKLAGDAPLVEAQKPVFIEFLKTIRIQQPASGQEGSTEAAAKPKWQVPSQWKELPAGQMQTAKFAVPPRGSARAEVSISVFPGDTGGTLANVNRWRKQIGLGEVDESGMTPLVSALDPANPDAKLVDMTNNKKRLVGAIVPRGGRYWFYKLLGDTEAVAPEKEAFVAFAKSRP